LKITFLVGAIRLIRCLKCTNVIIYWLNFKFFFIISLLSQFKAKAELEFHISLKALQTDGVVT
jgi:hypothetical protein